MEFKVYITVDIEAEDFDDAQHAIDTATNEFFHSLNADSSIIGYKVIDIEQK